MRLVLPILYHSQHFLIWYGYSEKSTQCSEHPVLLWDPVRKQICLKEMLMGRFLLLWPDHGPVIHSFIHKAQCKAQPC
uniref:Uncharacterized protein n=2 Tax=Anguilla anguilla TaxID=7936 RepID=A0A0E9TY06_ANGAN